jgi:hypothetical protein
VTTPLDLHLDACAQCERAMEGPEDLCPVGMSLLLTELELSYERP